MKSGKILGALLVVLLAVAAAAWLLRNSLIERFSGPYLEPYGLRITDISLRALTGNGASIAHLELSHTNGTTIVVEKLRMPVDINAPGLKVFAADRVAIHTVSSDNDTPVEIASWIDSLLSMPDLLTASRVSIERLELDDYDSVQDIDWRLASGEQVVAATLDGVRMTFAISPAGQDNKDIVVTLANSSLEARLLRRQDAFAINGAAAVAVAEWLPFASLLDIAPEDLLIRSGSADTTFELIIPHDPAAPLAASASLAVTEPLLIGLESDSGTLSLAIGIESAPLEFATTLPDSSWRLSVQNGAATAGFADWQNVPVSISGLECESGIRCIFSSKIVGKSVSTPYGVMKTLELNSSQAIEFSNGEITAEIARDASLRIGGLGSGKRALGLLEAKFGAIVDLALDDAGWEANIPALALRLEKLNLPDNDAANTTALLLSIGNAEITSGQKLVYNDQGVTVDVLPDAKIRLRDVGGELAEWTLLEATANSALHVTYSSEQWDTSVASLDLNLEKFRVGDTIVLTAPVYVENLTAASSASVLALASTLFIPNTKIGLSDQTVTAPGMKGTVAVKGPEVTASLLTAGIAREGAVSLQHNLDNASGRISVKHAGISLNARGLSDRVSPWSYDWSLNGGDIDLDMDATWSLEAEPADIQASGSLALKNLAGYYTDIAFLGLSSDVRGQYDSDGGVRIVPSSVTAELVDIGLPLHNIRADYDLQMEPLSADITNLELEAFGGRITADPFSYRTGGARNTLTLRAESVELKELLSVQDMEAINVSGSVSAVLPVTIEGDKVTIDTGHLVGEAPGGVIQYRGGNAAAVADGSGIGLVTKALSNFRYEALTSDVSYSPEGDLKLQMKLTGRNPDMDETRPVILNLGVESNIPEMLRSLQAARTVEDVLQKRLQQ